MLIFKIIITLIIIVALLFVKSLFKLSITKKQVERELADIHVTKILNPGTIETLSILPLVDYYAENETFTTEAGVSYYINADDKSILLDVGANGRKEHPSALLKNLKILGKKFDSLDFIYLSHLHLDHVGGMKDQKNATFSVSAGNVDLPEIPVYSPEPVRPSELNPGPIPEIITKPYKISEGIISIGAIPKALYLMGYTLENTIAFNLSGKGIVVVIGCGHQSIDKILERAHELFDEPVYGIIGGLHLPSGNGRIKIGPVDIQSIVGADRPPWHGVNKQDTEEAILAIKKANPSFIALSAHDSSDWTINRFKKAFGSKYHDLKVGRELVL